MQECRIGDALKLTKEIPRESIDLIVTSPPYWGLRNYGVDGQIGLEPTLEEYHTRLLEVTAECMRVLKPTGVMFWNHGDSYSGSGQGSQTGYGDKKRQRVIGTTKESVTKSVSPKCMLLQNERLIIKMIDDQGWILRNRIIWNKPNGMPSSVMDRFSNKYEPVYMLVKSNDTNYYYNSKTGMMQRDKPPGTKGEEGVDWDWKEVGSDYSESDTKIHADDAENLASPRARVYRENKVKKVSNWIGRAYWFDLDAVRVPFKDASEVQYRKKLRANKEYDVKEPYKTNTPYKHNSSRITSQESPNRMWNDVESLERQIAAGKNPGDVWDLKSPEDDWKQLLEVMSETVGVEAAISMFESYMQSRNVPADVWTIPTKPYSEAHFATFPTSLIEPMIKAACPAKICPVCGLARERIIDSEFVLQQDVSEDKGIRGANDQKPMDISNKWQGVPRGTTTHHTIGWTSCDCNAGWIAGTVFDPFYGSGTVGEVCRKLNLNSIGLELNPKYEPLIKERSMVHTPPLESYFKDD